MKYIGIDPGVTGAIAMIDGDGLLLCLDDLPMVKMPGGTVLDIHSFVDLLERYPKADTSWSVERQNPRPVQGVSSAFRTGRGFGSLSAMLDLINVSWSLVNPNIWKKAMGVTQDKTSSLLQARRLWPQADLGRMKDHNRAEALLIAEWARRRSKA